MLAQSLIRPGDEVALEVPNYMQLWGVPRSFGAKINQFHLRLDRGWEPDWEEFDRAVTSQTRFVYISNPNNPSGSVLSPEAMRRIVARCEATGAYLISDEVYQGAEIYAERTPSFWGMSDRVIVTSGLSKAYGIPGVRIGWIAGPADVIAECWSQHDYITIGPNKLSDMVARTAVLAENRQKCYARTREILQHNLPLFKAWLGSLGGRLSFKEPVAGALALCKYSADVPSYELCERIRQRQSVLIVPGIHLGLEGYVRIWIGGRPEFMQEGLRRIALEL
jgi:aspartate/methionine/tyrosine aminotransferase